MSIADLNSLLAACDVSSDQDCLAETANALLRKAEWLLEQVDLQISQPSIVNGDSYLKKKSSQPLVQGFSKFKTAIRAEHRFLQKLVDSPRSIKPAHVKCTNLFYLLSIYDLLQRSIQTQKSTSTFPDKVFQTFHYVLWKDQPDIPQERIPIRVDLVTNYGLRWVKVKASAMKNPLAGVEEFSSDEDEFDSSDSEVESDGITLGSHSDTKPSLIDAFRSCIHPESQFFTSPGSSFKTLPTIIRQAAFLKLAAHQNPVQLKTPEVAIKFLAAESINEKILSMLSSMGVTVEVGDEIMRPITSETAHPSTTPTHEFTPGADQLLNLDTTTLLCLVSELCHSFEDLPADVFHGSEHLTKQAEDEKICPLLPSLVSTLSGSPLVTTQDAFDKFVYILEHIGGPKEQFRLFHVFERFVLAHTFLAQRYPGMFENESECRMEMSKDKVSLSPIGTIRVIPNDPSDRFIGLASTAEAASARSRSRSSSVHASSSRFSSLQINVYGTGDKLRAVTVTSNSWMERSLAQAGLVDVGLFVHEPRSLIEQRLIRLKSGLPINMKELRKKE